MGDREGQVEPGGFSLNGLFPNETASVTQELEPERWATAEERTAELIACIQPNQPCEERRAAVVRYVQRLIFTCFPCQVFTFGSVPLKTYLPDGDINLTVFTENQNLKETWANAVQDILEQEEKNENAEFHVKEVQYIQIEVKIIKCLVENIVVDISFDQLGGLCTLCFLEEVDRLIHQNHLFKRSIILIKAWCYYESHILDAHRGLISTYALEILVLYIFNVFNNTFAGPLEVLYRFLEFFSKFDWENFCISLWGPVPICSLPDMTALSPRMDDGQMLLSKLFLDVCSSVYDVFPSGQENQEQPFISKYLNVIDPLRANNNLGSSVSEGDFFRIRSAFTFGARRLARLLDCPKEDLLAEFNQFFLNTWDRHGKGHSPDAPSSNHIVPRPIKSNLIDGSETIRNYSSSKNTKEDPSGHQSKVGVTHAAHASDGVSSPLGNHEALPIAFYPIGPPVPFLTMVPVYNVRTEAGTSSVSTRKFDRDGEFDDSQNNHSNQSFDSSENVDWSEISNTSTSVNNASSSVHSEQYRSDILNSDFASHWQNLQYGRLYQNSPFQAGPSRQADFYGHYADDIPRYRAGTGTYVPNPIGIAKDQDRMGGLEGQVGPDGFSLNGLLPNEAASVTQALEPERWASAEQRTAELLACIQPNQASKWHRHAVGCYVQRLIMNCIPCQVFTFGSVPLETYLPDGDINLTVVTESPNLKETWANQVRDILEQDEKNEKAKFSVKDVRYIQATVKIIKCLVENIVVDIYLNHLGGLRTLYFLEEVDRLIDQNHLFKRSIILIKAWYCYESHILDAHHGLISTYALETLVLYIFNVFNNTFSGPLEVLYRFLVLFSKFDWENFCISLWGPVPISSFPDMTALSPRMDDRQILLSKSFQDARSSAYAVFPSAQEENQEQPFISKYFNVIDPLRANNNLGSSVSDGDFFMIRSTFTFGAQRLAKLLDCPKEDLLAEFNQFFLNTWDRHGKGRRPEAPSSNHIVPRPIKSNIIDGSETIRNYSDSKNTKEDPSGHQSEVGVTHAAHASDGVSSQLGNHSLKRTSRPVNISAISGTRGQRMQANSTHSTTSPQNNQNSMLPVAPMFVGPKSHQRTNDSHGALPFAFYPTGPPVPYLTMLPVYDDPTEAGTSSTFTRKFDRDEEFNHSQNNHSNQRLDSSENVDWSEILNTSTSVNNASSSMHSEQCRSNILNSDFAIHWQNLQYGRFCQSAQNNDSLPHPSAAAVAPPMYLQANFPWDGPGRSSADINLLTQHMNDPHLISPAQPGPSRQSGFYRHYADDIPRYRAGTGTYLPNLIGIAEDQYCMSGLEDWVRPSGFSPFGRLPKEATSVTQALEPERWATVEERTAELIACIQPNQPSEERRYAVVCYVHRLIKNCFPCQVFTFGSVPFKTYLPDEDINLTVFSKNQNLKETWANEVWDILEQEEKNEKAEFHVKEVQYIQAEVKIIKCLVGNIVIEISFNQLGGLCALNFLEEVDQLIDQNHLFKRSIILIKAWCHHENRILGAHHGLISTQALEILVLYIFNVFNNTFAGPLEVLYRFLEFFSKFDWENFCISLYGPVPISSLPEMTALSPRMDDGQIFLSKLFLDICSSVYDVFPSGQENQEQPFISKYLNVIDPLRANNNLGSSVSEGDFFRIRSAFTFGAQRLARLLDCPKEYLLDEFNQFFLNTWDRHGKGHRPDVQAQ